MDLKFWIQILVPPFISAIISIPIAFWQYKKRKEEEKKVEALKVLLGVVRGWSKYVQSASGANTMLRNHIRGKTDEGIDVKKFSTLDDVESTVEIMGNYLSGLHDGFEKELEEIERVKGKIVYAPLFQTTR